MRGLVTNRCRCTGPRRRSRSRHYLTGLISTRRFGALHSITARDLPGPQSVLTSCFSPIAVTVSLSAGTPFRYRAFATVLARCSDSLRL